MAEGGGGKERALHSYIRHFKKGYMLGGGLGFLGRVLGLGCDRLLNVEMVLADGTVVNANKGK